MFLCSLSVCLRAVLANKQCTAVYQTTKLIMNLTDIIIYNKPTRCNSGSIVFLKNYKYAVHVSDALCVHLQEHYKL